MLSSVFQKREIKFVCWVIHAVNKMKEENKVLYKIDSIFRTETWELMYWISAVSM